MSDDTYNGWTNREGAAGTPATSDDSYQGWSKRETWALQLWLSNDQGLYNMTRERVAQCAADIAAGDSTDDPSRITPRDAGEAVKAFWDELTDPDEGLLPADEILRMVRDVGSECRIAWDEIGAAWLSDLDED